MSGLHLLAPITADQRDALRTTLLRAEAEFPFYREAFSRSGITPALVRADPSAALAWLPVFDPAEMDRLAREALLLRAHDLGGVELTSGTSGGVPKRRVLSEDDLQLDAAHVTRLLLLAGVRAEDRVAAVELSVTPLAAAFLEGCQRIGVRDLVAVAATALVDAHPILRLDPTVLITPPSLLARLAPALLATGAGRALRMVVYNGDRLPESTASAFRARGIGVQSLYGLTETSALGVECPVEQGVHLATEHALAEVRGAGPARELVVSTLGFSMPLLRYPTGDRVRVARGRCPCGSPWPRVVIGGRVGDQFSLFDVKLNPEELEALLPGGSRGFFQVVLTSGASGRERMTLRLPVAARADAVAYRGRLRAHPQLAYLLHAGLVELRLRYVEPSAGRKGRTLIDRRGRGRRYAAD